jgi:type IV pilus assembly protein PilA
MSKNKGFTLIELLVVIAIIGILASVVLASLNSARAKGADAAVKANLANIRAQAEIVYDTDGDYDAVCADTTLAAGVAAAGTAGGGTGVCNDSANAWAASADLKSTNVVGAATGTDYWCVDSTGKSEAVDNALGTNTAC